MPDLAGVERQRAAVGVERRLGVHDDAGALDQRRVAARRRACAEQVTGTEMSATGSRRVRKTVFDARAAADLGDLALDPDRAEPVDPLGDRVGDLPDRRRLLRGGLQGHGRDPRAHAHLRWGP